MEASTKKKVILFVSVSVVLGVGGYFGYQFLKDKGIIGKGGNEDSDEGSDETSEGGSSSSSSNSPTAAQLKLAKDYRLWANSTEALKNKYGKKSKYDLDAVSSSPYNSWFLNSFKAGESDFKKAKQQGAVNAVKNTIAKKQLVQTYPDDWYVLKRDELRNLFDGYTSATHERKIISIMKELKTNKDWGKLWSVFAKFEGWDLRKWLDYELNNTQLSEINASWASRPITLADGTPQRLSLK